MSRGKVLVIAPDPVLRRSLTFALEAEGHVVTAHATLLGADEGRGYDAVVLDHTAATSVPRQAAVDFCARAPRVVLLASHAEPWLATRVFGVVEKPHLGGPLTSAVAAAMAVPRQQPAAAFH